MTNINEQTNTLLYKNIISHTLFSKGWCWLCVRDELEMGIDCYIDPTVLLSHLGWVAQLWVTEGPKPSVCTALARKALATTTALVWKAIATANDTPAQLSCMKSHSYRQRYTRTAIWHDKAIATINYTPTQLSGTTKP